MAIIPPAWTIPAPFEFGTVLEVADAEEEEAEVREELAELVMLEARDDADADAEEASEEAELTAELALALILERRLETDALIELAVPEADAL